MFPAPRRQSGSAVGPRNGAEHYIEIAKRQTRAGVNLAERSSRGAEVLPRQVFVSGRRTAKLDPVRPLPPTLRDHFDHPRYVGRLDPPAVCGQAGNAACGDDLRLWIRVDAGRVVEAAFQARACSAVIAVASLVTEALYGADVETARELDPHGLAAAAGGLPGRKSHACDVVRRALESALEAGAA